eukprot:TRINITY_DN1521_c0_g1_i3.p1 TRINITY_DN1521_c0_g1~~TRINITY_DN1521_c0_g1_i3.p1  ORF type:complete len:580 (-),score=103.46 TRINITY_DN1521_c0_g1_i3:733-2472(-)
MRTETVARLCCCVLGVAALASAASRLTVTVDTATAAFNVSVDGEVWLHGGPVGVRSGGEWFSTQDGNLAVQNVTTGKGTDAVLGSFTSTTVVYQNGQNGSLVVHAIFKQFSSGTVLVFEQFFPNGANGTANKASSDDLASCFPSFTDKKTAFNYLTFQGSFAIPHTGRWNLPIFTGGTNGGMPMILYDEALRSLVVSPFDNFMAASQTLSGHFGDILGCGVQGQVASIPVGFRHATIVVLGTSPTQAMYQWGAALLQKSGKGSDVALNDITTQKLGYYTDNGAFYYYTTEPKKNYEQTMQDVFNYQATILPQKYYQFDSWWYSKGLNGGVKLWEPRTDIFPDGAAYVDAHMGKLPLVLHNRYFSPDTDYAANFSFAIENYCALPLGQDTFDYIMSKAVQWGMTMYEQDWLITTYQKMAITRNNVNVARQWLINMGKAASTLGITIQYCMPLPNYLLESTEIFSVSQARASDDYQPGNKNWQILHTSLLHWVLGLAPYKDVFWTTPSQTGCPYAKDDDLETNDSVMNALGIVTRCVVSLIRCWRRSCRRCQAAQWQLETRSAPRIRYGNIHIFSTVRFTF